MRMNVPVMQLLENRIPLTLLLDLADPDHLPSRAILLRETTDTAWVHHQRCSTESLARSTR